MTDLLERLRHPGYSPLPSGSMVLDHDSTRADMRDAADEIERLRLLVGVQRPDRAAIKDAIKAGHWFNAFTSDAQVGAVEIGSFLDEIADTVLASPQRAEGEAAPTGDLADRCREVLDWHQTGTLVDGALRRLAATIQHAPSHMRLELAEKQTADEAMRAFAFAPQAGCAKEGWREFVKAADALRASLPGHWHDDAVVEFDDARTILNKVELVKTTCTACGREPALFYNCFRQAADCPQRAASPNAAGRASTVSAGGSPMHRRE